MNSRVLRSILLSLILLVVLFSACRKDPDTTTDVPTGQFGGPGSSYTAQCSGWFPDWISNNPPPNGVETFQLAQGYPLGLPIIKTKNGVPKVTGWKPFEPVTDVATAPWLAYDFHVAAQQMSYLNALKDYAFDGMPEVDFVAQKNTKNRWYHVPMMTTKPTARREPYHGTTKERALTASQQSWITSGSLDSFAIGFYNPIGGYTIGQVFKSPDPSLSDPSAAQFIDGALVFKLIFAEYDTSKIDAVKNPLDGAPEWQVQDVENPSAPLKHVRLLQVDIAVKDSRSTQTGWVFATYVYDKTLSGADPWKKLTAIGLQWGNDPDVTASGVGTLDETWINPAVPAIFAGKVGRNGRLNGPVDNPVSSCISCHSTAQALVGATSANAFRPASLVPPGSCSNAQAMVWFRNLTGNMPFGVMNTCVGPSPNPPELKSLDFSLQLADGLESALPRHNPNPCQATITPEEMASATPSPSEARSKGIRNLSIETKRINVIKEHVEAFTKKDVDVFQR